MLSVFTQIYLNVFIVESESVLWKYSFIVKISNINLLRSNDVSRTSRIFRPKMCNIFSVLSII